MVHSFTLCPRVAHTRLTPLAQHRRLPTCDPALLYPVNHLEVRRRHRRCLCSFLCLRRSCFPFHLIHNFVLPFQLSPSFLPISSFLPSNLVLPSFLRPHFRYISPFLIAFSVPLLSIAQRMASIDRARVRCIKISASSSAPELGAAFYHYKEPPKSLSKVDTTVEVSPVCPALLCLR